MPPKRSSTTPFNSPTPQGQTPRPTAEEVFEQLIEAARKDSRTPFNSPTTSEAIGLRRSSRKRRKVEDGSEEVDGTSAPRKRVTIRPTTYAEDSEEDFENEIS